MPSRSKSSAVYSVALVEDLPEVSEQWAGFLEGFAGFVCVGTCSSGEEALEEIPLLKPDIVLMDIFLPCMSGIECTARLKALVPESRVLILTASDDEETIFPALEAGADGYLLKHSKPAELRRALRDILGGGVPMSSGIARKVANYFRRRGEARPETVLLSPREKELLDLLARGFINKEIADRMSLSIETVRSYLKNIYEKMQVHSRAGAVAKYVSGSGFHGNNTRG